MGTIDKSSFKKPYVVETRNSSYYVSAGKGYVPAMRKTPDRLMEVMAKELQNFIKQSEMKKPYMAKEYEGMEYVTPHPPYTPPNPPPPDIPGPPPDFQPPDIPIPIPNPTPTPIPGPVDPPPNWECFGCWGPLNTIWYCPGDGPISIPFGPACAKDPIVEAHTGLVSPTTGEGTASGRGGSVRWTPPGTDPGFCTTITATTKSGVHCHATACVKNDCCNCTSVSIGYTSQQMGVSQTQSLSIIGGTGCTFSWEVGSGGGSISSDGVYSSPSSNANCTNNPVINLKCQGAVVASLAIAINANVDPTWQAVRTWSGLRCVQIGCCITNCYITNLTYLCNGSLGYGPCETGRQKANYPNNTTCGECTAIYPGPAGCFSGNLAFDTLLASSPIDLRDAGMKTAGCCPQQLL